MAKSFQKKIDEISFHCESAIKWRAMFPVLKEPTPIPPVVEATEVSKDSSEDSIEVSVKIWGLQATLKFHTFWLKIWQVWNTSFHKLPAPKKLWDTPKYAFL